MRHAHRVDGELHHGHGPAAGQRQVHVALVRGTRSSSPSRRSSSTSRWTPRGPGPAEASLGVTAALLLAARACRRRRAAGRRRAARRRRSCRGEADALGQWSARARSSRSRLAWPAPWRLGVGDARRRRRGRRVRRARDWARARRGAEAEDDQDAGLSRRRRRRSRLRGATRTPAAEPDDSGGEQQCGEGQRGQAPHASAAPLSAPGLAGSGVRLVRRARPGLLDRRPGERDRPADDGEQHAEEEPAEVGRGEGDDAEHDPRDAVEGLVHRVEPGQRGPATISSAPMSTPKTPPMPM